MGRAPAEIWAADSELLPMRINPLPELFGGSPSLVASSALDTHDIGRKPMPIATAGAPAMIRPVARRLEAACDRLAVVITEGAGDAGRKARRLRRVKRMKQFQLEAPIHAADHLVHHRHAGSFRRLRILPPKIFIDELGEGSGDGHHLALPLDGDGP